MQIMFLPQFDSVFMQLVYKLMDLINGRFGESVPLAISSQVQKFGVDRGYHGCKFVNIEIKHGLNG